jgi:hypothetical protein
MTMQEQEREIIERLVSDVLAAGYVVSVFDGEATALKRSDDLSEIMGALASTDMDTLIVSESPLGVWLGNVDLVYGNDPWEVIADHTDTPLMRDLLAGAEAVADKIEADDLGDDLAAVVQQQEAGLAMRAPRGACPALVHAPVTCEGRTLKNSFGVIFGTCVSEEIAAEVARLLNRRDQD